MEFFNFSSSKRSKIQRFDYQPRYYDPIKEELDARVKMVKAETAAEQSSKIRKIRMGHDFKSFREHSLLFASKQKKTSRIRLIAIMALLAYICYYFISRF